MLDLLLGSKNESFDKKEHVTPMVYADLLTIFGYLLFPTFLGFSWGRYERMAADTIEEATR